METTIQNQGAMTLETLHESKEYRALTEKQKLWVDTFLDSQDAALATKTAYGENTNEAYRAMLTRKVETSARVLAALDLFYGRTLREKFLRDLELDISRAKGVARVAARQLFARVSGLIEASDPVEPAASKAPAKDEGKREGKPHRVLSMAAYGLTADEIRRFKL